FRTGDRGENGRTEQKKRLEGPKFESLDPDYFNATPPKYPADFKADRSFCELQVRSRIPHRSVRQHIFLTHSHPRSAARIPRSCISLSATGICRQTAAVDS